MAKPRRALILMAAGMAASFAFISVAAAGCDETGATHVEIARVTDDLDIVLKDERSIRLAGVKAFPAAGAPGQPDAKLDPKLLASIREATTGGTASLRPLTPIADRWGRIAADLFVGDRHLQSALVQAGLAVADPAGLRGPCWQGLKAAEAQARRANAGLWADKASLVPATDGAKLMEQDGLFILASGRVRHVSRGQERRRSYVDFGRRGENALYLTIEAKALTGMEKRGFKLEQLTKRMILVRGVVLNGRRPAHGDR